MRPVPVEYDLALFEQLNDEFQGRPIWSAATLPPSLRRDREQGNGPISAAEADRVRAATERSRVASKLGALLTEVSVSGKVALELGCGHGWLTASLATDAGARKAIGVDVVEYSSWALQDDPRIEFLVADLSRENVVEPETIDVIVSFVTFEHVHRPLQMLQALWTSLKTGGWCYLRTNLYRGRQASHRYREVFFPWPHLIFDDRVCEAFYEKHHGRRARFSWVNRMTAAEYLLAAREAGFDLVSVETSYAAIDVPFYLRFEDRLGRYPAFDLETDFLTLLLAKKRRRSNAVPSLPYLERQIELDRLIETVKVGGR